MGYTNVGWCTEKWLRLDDAIKKLTVGDLEIQLVLIWLEITGLKRPSLCTSWTCLGEERRGRECDLV